MGNSCRFWQILGNFFFSFVGKTLVKMIFSFFVVGKTLVKIVIFVK